jgi:hypothetical protein
VRRNPSIDLDDRIVVSDALTSCIVSDSASPQAERFSASFVVCARLPFKLSRSGIATPP